LWPRLPPPAPSKCYRLRNSPVHGIPSVLPLSARSLFSIAYFLRLFHPSVLMEQGLAISSPPLFFFCLDRIARSVLALLLCWTDFFCFHGVSLPQNSLSEFSGLLPLVPAGISSFPGPFFSLPRLSEVKPFLKMPSSFLLLFCCGVARVPFCFLALAAGLTSVSRIDGLINRSNPSVFWRHVHALLSPFLPLVAGPITRSSFSHAL